MKDAASTLDGRSFDVVVIGGGVTGASAAQQLAARGYDVLLVEKSDFCSGTSSRSSRLLYSGAAFLSPGRSLWNIVVRPGDFARRLMMARLHMQCRTQITRTTPARVAPLTFFYPVYNKGMYPGWKVDLGFRILSLFGSSEVPLDYHRIPAADAVRRYPILGMLRDQADLRSVGVFQEYQYDWAERLGVDAALDAERLGAEIRNYIKASRLEAVPGGGWRVEIRNERQPGDVAMVSAKVVINSAGPWIDRVNAAFRTSVGRRVIGMKGVSVLIRLPPECEGLGIQTLTSDGQPFYCIPWGSYHFFGPNVSGNANQELAIYEGDADDVRVLDSEIDFILGEANALFPSFNLKRADLVYAWAGVRPRTFTDGEPVRAFAIHDLAGEGMPDAFAVTNAPIAIHRHVGSELAERVSKKIAPTREPRPLSYRGRVFDAKGESPSISPEHPEIRISDLRDVAAREHVQTLADLLFRRVNLGWNGGMGVDLALPVAEAIADVVGWDRARIDGEVADYKRFVADHFLAAATMERAASARNGALQGNR